VFVHSAVLAVSGRSHIISFVRSQISSSVAPIINRNYLLIISHQSIANITQMEIEEEKEEEEGIKGKEEVK
jgi:hypothetical protein